MSPERAGLSAADRNARTAELVERIEAELAKRGLDSSGPNAAALRKHALQQIGRRIAEEKNATISDFSQIIKSYTAMKSNIESIDTDEKNPNVQSVAIELFGAVLNDVVGRFFGGTLEGTKRSAAVKMGAVQGLAPAA